MACDHGFLSQNISFIFPVRIVWTRNRVVNSPIIVWCQQFHWIHWGHKWLRIFGNSAHFHRMWSTCARLQKTPSVHFLFGSLQGLLLWDALKWTTFEYVIKGTVLSKVLTGAAFKEMPPLPKEQLSGNTITGISRWVESFFKEGLSGELHQIKAEFLHLFIYCLFNDAVNNSVHITYNGRTDSE
jgi:hypothetical protein